MAEPLHEMLTATPKSSGGDPQFGVPIINYITLHYEEPGDAYIKELRELAQLRQVRAARGSLLQLTLANRSTS